MECFFLFVHTEISVTAANIMGAVLSMALKSQSKISTFGQNLFVI